MALAWRSPSTPVTSHLFLSPSATRNRTQPAWLHPLPSSPRCQRLCEHGLSGSAHQSALLSALPAELLYACASKPNLLSSVPVEIISKMVDRVILYKGDVIEVRLPLFVPGFEEGYIYNHGQSFLTLCL